MSILGKCKHLSADDSANEQIRNDVKTLTYGDTDDDVPELEERATKQIRLSPELVANEAEQEIKNCLDRIMCRLEIFEANAKDLGLKNNASICTHENESFVQRQKWFNTCAHQENFKDSRQKYIAYIMWKDSPSMDEEEGFYTKSAQIVAYAQCFGLEALTPEVLEDINQNVLAFTAEANSGEWV